MSSILTQTARCVVDIIFACVVRMDGNEDSGIVADTWQSPTAADKNQLANVAKLR